MTGSPKKTSGTTLVRHRTKRGFWAMGVCLLSLFAAWPGYLSRLQGMPPSKSSSATSSGRKKARKSVSFELAGKGDDVTGRQSPSFALENLHDPNKLLIPKLAWLMSFPNSGTSFTMMSVLRASNFSTASNYGDEVTAKGDASQPVYEDRPEGPYWLVSETLGSPRSLPQNFVMVKTHCGSRCVNCAPREYMQSLEQFVDDCRRTSARVGPGPKRLKREFYYPTDRVHKAIHLVRHPITNIVSRFHQDSKNYEHAGREKWLTEHPPNRDGFRKWCQDIDNKHRGEESAVFSRTLLPELRMTPCHSEFFRYVQWHNRAFEAIEKMDIPSLLVHYEDYETSFEETFQSIFDFLELPRTTSPSKEFTARHDYDDYFATNETDRILKTVKMLASDTTWNAIQHYF